MCKCGRRGGGGGASAGGADRTCLDGGGAHSLCLGYVVCGDCSACHRASARGALFRAHASARGGGRDI